MSVYTMPSLIPLEEIVDKTYGQLLVISEGPREPKRNGRQFYCRCFCGHEKLVQWGLLSLGRALTCGYCHKDKPRKPQHFHGYSKTSEYKIWQDVIRRCYDPTRRFYMNYGGRGITVCERWREDFTNFLADLGARPSKKHTIERKDNNGHYEPNNCCWLPSALQQRNKRTNAFYVFAGQSKTLPEWAEILKLPEATLRARIEVYDWSVERAFTEPINAKYRKKGA